MVPRPLLVLLILSGLLFSGCKDGDRPDADPSKPPTTTQSSSDAASDSPSSDTTAIAPADGPVLTEAGVFTLHLPADGDWQIRSGGISATAFDDDLNPLNVTTSVVPLQAGQTGEDLDADYDGRTIGGLYAWTRGENRVLDGIEGWTAETVDDGKLIVGFGTIHERQSFSITFSFLEKDPRSREWIEATLASIEWK